MMLLDFIEFGTHNLVRTKAVSCRILKLKNVHFQSFLPIGYNCIAAM
jgi:hypothetical protein